MKAPSEGSKQLGFSNNTMLVFSAVGFSDFLQFPSRIPGEIAELRNCSPLNLFDFWFICVKTKYRESVMYRP